ncbi:UNVERIFIED_CONTAM: hypothetical protein HDU68_007872 [Siphonaria sp. JEL0065]|nr:hypothetical protein HDU68_007872 [Siphonaria sp. JEL0065]
MNLDKHPATISELLKFHEFKKTVKQDNAESFPESHYPLLAKLIQDSDSTLVTLTKYVKELLFPDLDGGFDEDENNNDEGFTLPDSEISKAITTIASRNNYGLQIDGLAIPATFSIWRWEVTDLTLLGEFRDRFEARIKNRSQVRQDLGQIYEGFGDDEKEGVVVGGSKRQSVPPKTPVLAISSCSSEMALDVEMHGSVVAMEFAATSCAKTPGENAVPSSLPCPSSVGTPTSVSKGSTTKTSKQLLKEKKEAEKLAALKAKEEAKEKKEQEKREAKEAKEELKRKKEEEKMLVEKAKEEARQKKEEDRLKAEKAKEEGRTKKDVKRVDKSQPSLSSFIFKVQKEVPPPPPVITNQEEASILAFRERFPQFHVKLRATVAQHNRFFKQTPETVIGEIMRQDSSADITTEFKSFLSTNAKTMRSTLRTKKQSRLLVSQAKLALLRKQSSNLQDAAGDTPEEEEEDPYKKYRHLKWKLLQFAEDFRPAYFGTWTKKSTIATRGKNPWRKEVVPPATTAGLGGDSGVSGGWVMNYEVDSEAEWEEDEPGEELGSEIDEEEGGGGDKSGGGNHGADGEVEEVDDWMVPDGYLSEDEADNEEEDEIALREASDKNCKEVPKRKIGPLVPVVMCWFGNEEQGAPDAYLETFQLSWMIDEATIDPFIFRQKNAPALSDAATPQSKQHSSGPGSTHKSLAKALKANGERHSLDENDLGEFVTMIQGSTLPLPQLVALTKERFTNVSKVQLELKVRQIAEKRRVVGAEKQVWYIKPDYQKYCLPGSIPELVVVAAPVPVVPVPVAPRSLDPNVVRRKAASKPSIIDPPTSPLPESPRHFVKSSGGWDEDDIVGDILAEGEGDGDVEVVIGEVREDNYFGEAEMTVDESVAGLDGLTCGNVNVDALMAVAEGDSDTDSGGLEGSADGMETL